MKFSEIALDEQSETGPREPPLIAKQIPRSESMKTDLTTTYLGLELPNPIVASASPLTAGINMLCRLQEAGVAAAVFPSIFEEQIAHGEMAKFYSLWGLNIEDLPGARAYFPEIEEYNAGPEDYLRLIEQAKQAATTGVHTATDALKLLLAGADVTMIASALLKFGPGHVTGLLEGIAAWMQERGYTTLRELRGTLSARKAPEPAAFERAHYIRALTSYTHRAT